MSCPPPGRGGEGNGTGQRTGLLPPGVRVRVSRFTARIRNGIAPAPRGGVEHDLTPRVSIVLLVLRGFLRGSVIAHRNFSDWVGETSLYLRLRLVGLEPSTAWPSIGLASAANAALRNRLCYAIVFGSAVAYGTSLDTSDLAS